MDLLSYLKRSQVRQQDFAETVGKSQGLVSRIATGKSKLRDDQVIKWAAATGFIVTPHDLRPDMYPKPSDGVPEQASS
ncbi:MAG: helix-turn-helix domain-containing protein [Dickeya sp.]